MPSPGEFIYTPRFLHPTPILSDSALFLYSIVSATFPYLSFPASLNHQYPVFNKERQKLVEEAPELSSTAPGTWNSQMLSSAHPLMLPIPPPALESWSFPLPRETFSEYPLSLIFCFLPGTSHQPLKMLKSLPCEKKTPLWAFLSHPSIPPSPNTAFLPERVPSISSPLPQSFSLLNWFLLLPSMEIALRKLTAASKLPNLMGFFSKLI